MQVDGKFVDFEIEYITAITELFDTYVADKTGFATVEINNKYGIPDHPCTVVISAYNNADKLVGVKTYEYNVPADGRDGSMSLNYPTGPADYIKVMVFTDLSGLIPYLTDVPRF